MTLTLTFLLQIHTPNVQVQFTLCIKILEKQLTKVRLKRLIIMLGLGYLVLALGGAVVVHVGEHDVHEAEIHPRLLRLTQQV